MYYSAIGLIAIGVLIIVNQDILRNHKESYVRPVWKVYRSFVKTGHTNVRIKLYRGCRHEIMHDVCKEEFTEDILRFIGAR